MSQTVWRLPVSRTRTDLNSKCLFCRIRSSNARSDGQPHRLYSDRSSQIASKLRPPIRRRQFHTTSCERVPASSEHATGEVVPEYNFSINAQKQSRHGPQLSPTNSQIRSSLRAWSAQNESVLRDNAPDKIGAAGRISRLPNALFSEKSSYQVEPQTRSDSASAGIVDENGYGDSQLIQPGTLLWYTGLGTSGQFAVYVDNIGVQSLLALENGNWAVDRLLTLRSAASDASRLRVPGFVAAEELVLLRKHMPRSTIARPIADTQASSEISMKGLMPPELIDGFMAKMREFRQAFNDHMRKFAQQFDQGYLRVAHDQEYRTMDIRDFLQRGFEMDWDTLDSSERLAVTHHLNAQDAVTTYQTAETISILVMPKAKHTTFQQIIEWARHYQDTASQAALGRDVSVLLNGNPLTGFIDKARQLILLSRKTRSPTVKGGLGPTSFKPDDDRTKLEKTPTGVEFTETDKAFIDYIWTMSFRLPLAQPNGPLRYLPVVSLILRAVGAYPDLVLNHIVARLFLKEIGCADPWTPRSCDLALPLSGGKASHVTDELYNEMQDYVTYWKNEHVDRHISDQDSMRAMRKDWGSMTAFAIDPAESQLPEDAISIQPATEMEGAYWVHVHVAHVTAFFAPESIVGRFARNQGASFSSIDKSVRSTMLPKPIAESFTSKEGAPVLTISTLVGHDGTSLDIKITAGRIWNVVKITRDAVDEVLRVPQRSISDTSRLSVGEASRYKKATIKPGNSDYAQEHKDDLQTLFTVLQQRSQKRIQEIPETISIPRYSFDLDVQVSPMEVRDSAREQTSYHWKGDPSISLSAQHSVYRTTELRRASDVVAQAMRLASESAARWLDARGIPAVFMGTEPVSDNSYSTIASKQPHEQFIMPLFKRSSSPVPYWNYHLRSYCSCTSPLRRYVDMVALWQIDSYLKAEAANLVEPGAPISDQKVLNFTQPQINEYLRVDAHAMETVDHTLRRIKETYIIQALFRAFHFEEAPLPKQWEVLILDPAKLSANLVEKAATGYLIPFGCNCEIQPGKSGWDKMAQHGQYLPVTIEAVDTERLTVLCRADGPPKNDQMHSAPFEAVSQNPES